MRDFTRRDFSKLASAGALTSAAWGTFAIAQGAAKVVIVGGGAGGADITLVALYQRKAGGSADGRMSFILGAATSAALAVAAVRGIDAALPLGPTNESLGSNSSAVYLSPEARPGTRWIGFGAAPVHYGTFAVPGMLEHAGNGHVSILFGEPEAMANGLLVFSLPSPGNDCAILYLRALLPPPSPTGS
jgi:hypothetical protein